MHFRTAAALPNAKPVDSWEEFVPPAKLAALKAYDPSVKGHPPFGGGRHGPSSSCQAATPRPLIGPTNQAGCLSVWYLEKSRR